MRGRESLLDSKEWAHSFPPCRGEEGEEPDCPPNLFPKDEENQNGCEDKPQSPKGIIARCCTDGAQSSPDGKKNTKGILNYDQGPDYYGSSAQI